MKFLLLVLVVAAACAKKAEEKPPEAPPVIPAEELKRGEDACNTYIAKVCACAAEAAKEECKLAKALPEAIRVSLEIGGAKETGRHETIGANNEVRKVIKGCIESLAALPAIGCP